MAKQKFGLVGNAFTHITGGNKGYSVHGKVSKCIQWVPLGNSDTTFYIDAELRSAFYDKTSDRKYGWLLESKHITPEIVSDVFINHKTYTDIFDLIFTHNQALIGLNPEKFKFVPAQGYWIKDAKIYDKTKLISTISSRKNSTPGHIKRVQFIENNINKMDVYGRGFNEIEFKEQGLCDYMFSVAIENGSYKTYFTEKILDCFATGTIPIYWGAPDIGEYFDISSILLVDETNLDTLSKDFYYDNMESIKFNLEQTKKIEILEDFIYNTYLSEAEI